jgi:hypothetical protein
MVRLRPIRPDATFALNETQQIYDSTLYQHYLIFAGLLRHVMTNEYSPNISDVQHMVWITVTCPSNSESSLIMWYLKLKNDLKSVSRLLSPS